MTTPSSAPAASSDTISRSIVVEGDVRMMERMRKEADIRGFTIFCDEGVQIGGDGSAPAPLSYFASSIMF